MAAVYDENKRLLKLRETALLDTPAEAAFDELTRLACHICETPAAFISLVDDQRQWFKSTQGFDLKETPREQSFCAHVVLNAQPMIVPDAINDPRFARNPHVTGHPGIRFYAGAPLTLEEGVVLGSLAVVDTRPRNLDASQINALCTLAHQVVTEINLRMRLRESIGRENDLKRINDRLSQNESHLRMALRVSRLGAWWVYLGSEINARWSQDLYRIFELPEDYQPNVEEDIARFLPEYRPILANAFEQCMTHGTSYALDAEILTGKGNRIWVRTIGEAVRDASGKIYCVQGTMQDITQQRRIEETIRASEERFRLLARATNDVIWDWNLQTDELWWSDGLESVFGYTRNEVQPNIGSWTTNIHPEDAERIYNDVKKAIVQGEESWSGEYRFLRKDGSYAYVLDRGHIMRDASGKAVRMIGGMSDLSERKKLEEQFFRAQRLESIGTLAGGIAHDLNNLLSPILMGVDLLRAQHRDEKSTAIIDSISQSARRGADLVRQVLSFARGVDGARVIVQPASILREMESIILNTFPKNILFSLHTEPDLWTILADPTQLNQVLLNLCVNARDAMPEGGRLTLSASNVELDKHYVSMESSARAGHYLLIEVSDEGCGMEKEVLERAFEPFFTTKEIGKGTGLGLSTVVGILRSHGGYINSYSEPGKGSRFKIYLPAHTLSGAHPKENMTDPDSLPRGSGQGILVVDDEDSILTMTRQTLEAYGYRVFTASNGAQAIAHYAQNRSAIDAVLTDMMMPVMDGPALIRALQRINPGLLIIAASGLDANGAVARASLSGIEYFLPKPYSAEKLLNTLHTALPAKP